MMTKSFTSATLKANNKRNILKYIYSQKKTTPNKISSYLNLSRPTTAQIVKELVQDELIRQEGFASSTGGRKAHIYAFNQLKQVAIGVEIRMDRYEIVAIDLYANMLKYETFTSPYQNIPAYYDGLALSVNNFIDSLHVAREEILGIGIGLQALISSNGETIMYGKVLGCTGLKITEFSKRIPHTCYFNHDAESLANSELWQDTTLNNAIFFNIRDNLSGTVIINRSFFRGSELKSGVFEHMNLFPGGKPCYCGKKGCVNAYCSFSALLEPDEEIDSFFQRLHTGNQDAAAKWEEYLSNLALAIDNLHMLITSDVIIGGKLSNYLTSQDLESLHQKVHKLSAFPSDEHYIRTSKTSNVPLCIGAAIPLVKKHLDSLF